MSPGSVFSTFKYHKDSLIWKASLDSLVKSRRVQSETGTYQVIWASFKKIKKQFLCYILDRAGGLLKTCKLRNYSCGIIIVV